MRRTLETTILLGLLAALAVGCSSRREAGVLPQPTNLIVENRSFSQMRIYAVAAGQRVRLGVVNGHSTARLRIPDSVIGGGRELSFQVSPLAGRGVVTRYSFWAYPGVDIELMIPGTIR
jgi:hypothetical protein